MNENDKDLIRSLMYADDPEDSTQKKKPLKEVKITSAPKTIVIESDGKKHQVPTMNVFNGLLKESHKQQNDLRDAQTSIKKLTETVKKLDAAIKQVERDVLTKADRYDT